MNSLETIKQTLLSLSSKDLQEFSDICSAVEDEISGDGGGLTSGFLIDKLICEFFAYKLKEYEEYHVGEADFKLSGCALSFKKIRGSSAIALSWSKNPKTKQSGVESIKRDYWEFPLLILNLKTEKWWKTEPKKIIDKKIPWNLEMKRGFYIVDNEDAFKWVKLGSNNKSDSIVSKEQMYKCLFLAKEKKLFVPLPEANTNKGWSILGGIKNLNIFEKWDRDIKKYNFISVLYDECEKINKSEKELDEWAKDKSVIRIIGSANAGKPLASPEETLVGHIYYNDKKIKINKSTDFVLRVEGDSMNNKKIERKKKIEDGSFVVVRKTSEAESGDVVVSIVKNEGVNIKEYKKIGNKIILKSCSTNKENKDLEISEELGFVEGDYVHLGKVIDIF